MKNILWVILFVSGTANALDPGDYGYGYRYHGYNSLEQQQEAEHNQYNLQQIEQTQLDMQLNNRINGGQPPQFREDRNVVNGAQKPPIHGCKSQLPSQKIIRI